MKTKMRTRTLICTSMVIGLVGTSAYATGSWNVETDWNPSASPSGQNGQWAYGEISGAGGAFTALPWVPVSGSPNANGYYGFPSLTSGAFVYQNTATAPYYGIAPGQISIESDYGSAAVQWTAPANGTYNIAVALGGTTAQEGPGYGNNFAQYAGLTIGGSIQTASSFVNNVMSWNIDNVTLTRGETIDAYVINPGFANGGNTAAANFTVTAVPEPTTMVAGAMLLLPFGMGALRFLRNSRTE